MSINLNFHQVKRSLDEVRIPPSLPQEPHRLAQRVWAPEADVPQGRCGGLRTGKQFSGKKIWLEMSLDFSIAIPYTELVIPSVAIFCYVCLWELWGSSYAAGNSCISQSTGGISQITIFQTLRQRGWLMIYYENVQEWVVVISNSIRLYLLNHQFSRFCLFKHHTADISPTSEDVEIPPGGYL